MTQNPRVFAALTAMACSNNPLITPYSTTETTLYHEASEDTATPIQAEIAERVHTVYCGPWTLSTVASPEASLLLTAGPSEDVLTSGLHTAETYCERDGGVFDTEAEPCALSVPAGESLYLTGPPNSILSIRMDGARPEAGTIPGEGIYFTPYGVQYLAGNSAMRRLVEDPASTECDSYLVPHDTGE